MPKRCAQGAGDLVGLVRRHKRLSGSSVSCWPLFGVCHPFRFPLGVLSWVVAESARKPHLTMVRV